MEDWTAVFFALSKTLSHPQEPILYWRFCGMSGAQWGLGLSPSNDKIMQASNICLSTEVRGSASWCWCAVLSPDWYSSTKTQSSSFTTLRQMDSRVDCKLVKSSPNKIQTYNPVLTNTPSFWFSRQRNNLHSNVEPLELLISSKDILQLEISRENYPYGK